MGSPFPDMHPEIKLGMHPKKMRYTSVAKDRGMEYGVWSMDDHDRPTGGTSGRGPNAARIALAAKRPQPRSRAGCLGVDRAATCGDVPWTRAPPSALHCPRVGAPPPPRCRSCWPLESQNPPRLPRNAQSPLVRTPIARAPFRWPPRDARCRCWHPSAESFGFRQRSATLRRPCSPPWPPCPQG